MLCIIGGNERHNIYTVDIVGSKVHGKDGRNNSYNLILINLKIIK
jgi:hypothetical protein